MYKRQDYRKSQYLKYMDIDKIGIKNMPPFYIVTSSGDFLHSHSYKMKITLDRLHVENLLHDFKGCLPNKKCIPQRRNAQHLSIHYKMRKRTVYQHKCSFLGRRDKYLTPFGTCCLWSVSYTHLDVYKRQVICSCPQTSEKTFGLYLLYKA